jgi:hypothetical protein
MKPVRKRGAPPARHHSWYCQADARTHIHTTPTRKFSADLLGRPMLTASCSQETFEYLQYDVAHRQGVGAEAVFSLINKGPRPASGGGARPGSAYNRTPASLGRAGSDFSFGVSQDFQGSPSSSSPLGFQNDSQNSIQSLFGSQQSNGRRRSRLGKSPSTSSTSRQQDYSYAYPPGHQGSVGLQGGMGTSPQPTTHLHQRKPVMSQSKSSTQLRMRRKVERLERKPNGRAGGGFGYQNKLATMPLLSWEQARALGPLS